MSRSIRENPGRNENKPMSESNSPRRKIVVALLMAVMVISVLDKTIFGFAGVQIMEDLKLTPEQFGFVGSAFFFLYSLSGVLVGFLANRFSARWILVGMSLIWTTSQLMVTFASSLLTLTISRLVLGAGCGPGTAVTQHAAFKWYGPSERVLPASLIQVSLMLGGVIGAITLPFSIEHFGWRMAYMALAMLSLLWIAAWLMFGAEGEHSESAEEQAEAPRVGYHHLLFNRSFLWLSLICFLAYMPNALAFSWMSVYVQKGLGLTPMHTGYLMLAATLSIIVANLVIPGLSHSALQRGASVQRAMVLPPLLCCMLGGISLCLMAFVADSVVSKLGFYLVGAVALNVVFAFGMSITAHITPSVQRAAMLALHVASLTASGMLTPWLVGKATVLLDNDVARGFESTLGFGGLAILLCALLGLVILKPEATRLHLLTLRNRPDTPEVTVAACVKSN